MPSKLRLVSVFLVATLIVVAGCSIIAFRANAQTQQLYKVYLRARHQDLACFDIGTIVVDSKPFALPATLALLSGDHQITFPVPPGCVFVAWEVDQTDGGILVQDPKAMTTAMVVRGEGTLRVVYKGTCCVIGGVITETNTLVVLAPYLVAVGLIATTAAVAVRKRRK